VSLDDRLHQINQGLRLFHEGGVMMFPVEEFCDGKGLVDKYPSSSLYLMFRSQYIGFCASLRGICRAA
jgi:hypothetical protein